MARNLVTALLVGPRAIRWTTIRNQKGVLEVVQTRDAPLEFGGRESATLFDVTDQNHAQVGAEIRARCGRIPGLVTIGIPSSRVLMRVMDLPAASIQELHGMVELQVDKISPFPAESMSVSYELLAEKDGSKRILIAAVQNEVCESLRRSLSPAGVRIRHVDIDVLGWWRLLQDEGQLKADGRHAVVIDSADESVMVVIESGVPIMFRSLGTRGTLSDEEFAAETAREIAHSLASLEIEHGASVLDAIELWHPGEAPALLVERIREECGLATELHSIAALPPVTVGMARRAAQRTAGRTLDITPAAWHQAEQTSVTRRKLVLASAAVALVWLLGVGGLFGWLQYQKFRLDSMKKRLAALEVQAEEVRATRNRVRALEQYADRSHSALESLLEVVKLQPASITMNTFIYKKGKTVTVSGEAAAASLVYEFKQALDKSDLFGKITLDGPTKTRDGKESFKMSAELPGTPQGGTP